MQIEVIIKDLLNTNECVIVPQFGGFVSNYKSATVKNSPFATFAPPTKHIVFNEGLKVDDGLLANTLSNEYNLSFDDAKKEIENFVLSSKSILKKEGSFLLKGIGVLRSVNGSSIILDPDYSENLLTDSFGLETFEFAVLKDPEIIRKENKKFKDISLERKKRIAKYARRAVIALPVVLAFIILPGNINKSQFSSFNFFKSDYQAPKEISIKAETPAQEQIKKNSIETQIDKTVDKRLALKYIEPSQELTNTIHTEENNYFIIAGSFTQIDNANKLIQELSTKNIDAKVLEGNGYFRVYIDGFNTKENAETRLSALRQKYENFSSYWIYKK